jgi:hypothetical protein
MSADAHDALAALLAVRAPGATICPSEVARAIAVADDWRRAMPAVHDAVDELVAKGKITLSWKGKPMTRRAGPYRIGDARTAALATPAGFEPAT